MSSDLEETLKQRLAQLEPETLEIINESHLHQGHAGNQNGASHFRVTIVSKQFAGLSRVAAQRLVYSTVSDLMPFPIHALALQTRPLEN